MLPSLPGKADVVVGMRRSGKTWYLFQTISDLLRRGVGRDRILYINFEDERLQPMTSEHLHLVTDTFYRRNPTSRDAECWLLFDEIQNVSGWERYVRRLLDNERVRIVVTVLPPDCSRARSRPACAGVV